MLETIKNLFKDKTFNLVTLFVLYIKTVQYLLLLIL